MIYRDPRGVEMIACEHCMFSEQEVNGSNTCPECGAEQRIMQVECAEITHNDEGGCTNPTCWKHPKKQVGTLDSYREAKE